MPSLKNFAHDWLLPPRIFESLKRMLDRGQERFQPLYGGYTREEKVLMESVVALKDKHKGSRCFIMGAGPSILRQDISKLKGEYVISVSNTFVHRDYPLIRPQYHVLPNLLGSHTRFFPVQSFVDWLREMETKTYGDMILHVKDRELVEKNNLFMGRTIRWMGYSSWKGEAVPVDLRSVPQIWSVSELAVTVALYLGFEKIYLLGFDHDWFNGLNLYFYDVMKEHKLKPKSKHHLEHVDAEFQMRRHADIFKKYKYLYGLRGNIFNANADPNHYMDVFPKVEYESLFAEGTAAK